MQIAVSILGGDFCYGVTQYWGEANGLNGTHRTYGSRAPCLVPLVSFRRMGMTENSFPISSKKPYSSGS